MRQLFAIVTFSAFAVSSFLPQVQSLRISYTKRNPSSTRPPPSSSSSLFSNFQQRDVKPQRRRPYQQDYVPYGYDNTQSSSFTTPRIDTKLQRPPPTKPQTPHPKIVVLGATGKVGRRIISQLMSMDTQMTIVAICRSYDVACDVLYDELTALDHDTHNNNNRGPRLQLVVTDLIGKQNVAGYDPVLEQQKMEQEDLEFAVSASRFYNQDLNEFDYRQSQTNDAEVDDWMDPDLRLQEAIRNCTVVISSVGTVRPTIPFGDYIFHPWRVFLSPGRWCRDERHPYYVNYLIMKKVLRYVEREQMRREHEWGEYLKSKDEEDEDEDNNHDVVEQSRSKHINAQLKQNIDKNVEKIRIIRISDLCVSNPPWNLVTMITNIALSLVFRYQEKCEKLLEASSCVDTIVLRPGDLMEAERVSSILTKICKCSSVT